jgi:hypothetical protein
MAAFTSEEEDKGQIDYELLSGGAVSGFRDETQLDFFLSQLRNLGYGIAETRGGSGAPCCTSCSPRSP